ncbi:50S ribosomal protein L20 [Haloplasma contractile]|uniref:Large ribosomal subunit protein bL20 n=1 Tax=Haloplasma contractile SSD-17B TaxID=1033810 RepID=U2DXP0_9MOLU|nr:50S ribosomal protein L20 [Haloplasma contractile]ERJ13012.1 50S ribosomal protein L20 [Haloplasma contractile SSD-17B]
MPRVKGGNVARKRRKKILKLAKGYFGSKHTLYKTAHEQVMKSLAYAYRDRKQRKRDFRKLWITRINAGCRMQNLSYSKFMYGLKLAGIEVNRKMLADLAIHDLAAFNKLVELAKDAMANPEKYTKEEVAQPKKAAKKPAKKVEETKVEETKAEPKKEVKPEKKNSDNELPSTKTDLKKLTVAKLKDLAKSEDISIPSNARKAEIIDIIFEELQK